MKRRTDMCAKELTIDISFGWKLWAEPQWWIEKYLFDNSKKLFSSIFPLTMSKTILYCNSASLIYLEKNNAFKDG